MKLFLKPVHPNFYFGVGTLIVLPGACDPANRDRFRRRRGPYQGHYRQRHSELLALLCSSNQPWQRHVARNSEGPANWLLRPGYFFRRLPVRYINDTTTSFVSRTEPAKG